MTMIHMLRAVLLGVTLVMASYAPASAQILRVVEGQTSASLRVPMNRAVVVESDVLFAELSIANPAIADISPLGERNIYVLGRMPGRTTMTLLGADGSLIANVEVQVVPDVAELRERLQDILAGEPIEVRTANDGIVMSGIVSSGRVIERAMQLAERYTPGRVSNLMMVGGTQQVMLQVRFAEMSRTVTQELSTSLGLSTDFGGGDVGATLGTFGTPTGPVTGAPANLAGRTGGLGVSFAGAGLELSILLEALETNGLVRTLAEPNLTALSGESASFLAGGEFPIPVQSEDGVGVDFKPFGVNMSFTPTVVDDEIINLSLQAEVSSLGEELSIGGGASIPSTSTRRASTTIEMRDGQSFAIAGLLQDDFTSSIGRVPWLGDIPVLGALFRSSSYLRSQSELVVIITAHLVTPVQGEALSLPIDRVAIPTERELFLEGRLVGAGTPSGGAGDVAQQDFSGSYGYVLD